MAKNKKVKLGSRRVVQLFVRLTLYYFFVFLILWGSVRVFPEARTYLPFGGSESLMAGGDFESILTLSSPTNDTQGYLESGLRLFAAILGALLVMTPVSWVYLKIRLRAKLDQSLVETMLILPIAVAGVVVIVKNNLALAFSLAGIVAGVRFRNTLKNTGDSLFIFTAIGAGLAAGVGALEIAVVVTMTFNYVFLVLWDLDYGAAKSGKSMRSSTPKKNKRKK